MQITPEFSRKEMLKRAKQSECFDLVIIGGGIHGASLVRQASELGLNCLLLEQKDFGFGISSRSSKMLHGGVRYLEGGHFSLVREALSERAYQLLQAPHLCRRAKFLLPTFPRSSRPGWQMRIGLVLYDLLARVFTPAVIDQSSSFPMHTKLNRESSQWQTLESLGCNPSGLLQYSDGQMDDTRLVIENCIAAAANGASVLNKAKVNDISYQDNTWKIGFSDKDVSNIKLNAKFLVNLAGPWVREVHQCWQPWQDEWHQPVYVRGTHLLFDFPWPTDGLIVPSKESGRYYFIWPYFSAAGTGTLVGPTSVHCEDNEDDCQPSEEEIDELLAYLAEDFSGLDFSRKRMSHAFAGMRILAGPSVKKSKNNKVTASQVSREDVFIEQEAYIALLGGKYTTSRKTAENILRKVLEHSSRLNETTKLELKQLSKKLLPGAVGFSDDFRTQGIGEISRHFSLADSIEGERLVRAAVERFGSRALTLLQLWPEFGSAGQQGRSIQQREQSFVRALARFCVLQEGAVDKIGIYHRLGWDDFPQLVSRYDTVIMEEISSLAEYM